jgi:hypothetical protein
MQSHLQASGDDSVMTKDGITGIIVGMDGSNKVDVLWTGFKYLVTKVDLKDVDIIKFPAKFHE